MGEDALNPSEIVHPPSIGATCVECGEHSSFKAVNGKAEERVVFYQCQRAGCDQTMQLHMDPGQD